MNAHELNLVKDACENMQHVPYYFSQKALGVDDGGYASLYDSYVSGEYDGRFNNEIGGNMLSYVLGRVGTAEFEAKAGRLFDQELISTFSDRLSEGAGDPEISAMAERVADATVAHLAEVFPTLGTACLADDRIRIKSFFEAYMKAEIAFAASFSEAPAQVGPRA